MLATAAKVPDGEIPAAIGSCPAGSRSGLAPGPALQSRAPFGLIATTAPPSWSAETLTTGPLSEAIRAGRESGSPQRSTSPFASPATRTRPSADPLTADTDPLACRYVT